MPTKKRRREKEKRGVSVSCVIDTSFFSVGQIKSENSIKHKWGCVHTKNKINNRYRMPHALCDGTQSECERGDVKRGEKTNYHDLFQPQLMFTMCVRRSISINK